MESKSEFRITSGHQIHSPCKQMSALGHRIYGPDVALPLSVLENWYAVNPDGYFLAYDNDNLIAYLLVIPIDGDEFERCLKCDFDERTTKIKAHQNWSSYHHLLLSSLVAEPAYQGKSTVSIDLRIYFFQKIIESTADSATLFHLVGQTISPQGEKCAISMGLSYQDLTENQWRIYSATLNKLKLIEIKEQLMKKRYLRLKSQTK